MLLSQSDCGFRCSAPSFRIQRRVVLPAGAGKTELIARATCFASETVGRQLILTHTHAGVHALRDRLARLGVAPQSYTLTTIAGGTQVGPALPLSERTENDAA